LGILVQSLGEVGHYVKPKNRSGLGVQTARDMNVSLLGKHVWSMLHERNKLWVELLSKKSTILHDNIKPGTSYLWIFILKAAAILELGFRFRVGEGKGSM